MLENNIFVINVSVCQNIFLKQFKQYLYLQFFFSKVEYKVK